MRTGWTSREDTEICRCVPVTTGVVRSSANQPTIWTGHQSAPEGRIEGTAGTLLARAASCGPIQPIGINDLPGLPAPVLDQRWAQNRAPDGALERHE
jgi:hypothetical protein